MFSSLSYHLLAHTERRFRKSICGNDKVIDIFVILQDREAKDAAVRTVGGTGYHAATRSDSAMLRMRKFSEFSLVDRARLDFGKYLPDDSSIDYLDLFEKLWEWNDHVCWEWDFVGRLSPSRFWKIRWVTKMDEYVNVCLDWLACSSSFLPGTFIRGTWPQS